MSEAHRIDGKAFAENLRGKVAEVAASFEARAGRKAGLAVVLVGDDPASQIYVRNKGKQTVECGMNSYEHLLPDATPEADLLALVDTLNKDPAVDGILVQLPLPGHMDEQKVIAAIDPDKDVDGFHVINSGRLSVGLPGFVPCTPLGCLMLLKDRLGSLSGLDAVVIGRSNIVGKPMAALLLAEHSTVTLCHIHTRGTQFVCRGADIIVSAVGKPGLVRGDWIKPRAVVIDVGTTRVPDGKGGFKLKGDVEFDEAVKVAGAITPVPGGVGPMTIACLMENTLTAAIARRERAEGAWPVLS